MCARAAINIAPRPPDAGLRAEPRADLLPPSSGMLRACLLAATALAAVAAHVEPKGAWLAELRPPLPGGLCLPIGAPLLSDLCAHP